MGGLSPFIQAMYAYNDQGQGGQISGPTGLSGFQPAAWGAQDWADQDLANRTQNIVNPRTGQLTRQPRTQAEMAAAQSQLEKWANQQNTGNYNQAMGMLQSSFGGGMPGMGGYSGGMGGGVPGGADAGLGGYMPNPGGSVFGGGGNFQAPQAGANMLNRPSSQYQMAVNGKGTPQQMIEANPYNASQPFQRGSYGMPASDGGGFSNQFGAGGQMTFAPGGIGGYAGGTDGGGFSSGTTAGGYAVNANLHDMFTDRLQNMLQHPGLDDATVNKMVNRGNDSLAENENSAALALQEKASASGFGASGAQQAGLQQLYQNFAGQKANNQRDVTTQAEQDRLNRQQQAMSTAGDYLSHVQDRAAADALRQTQMQRDDRNQMMQMLMNKQTSVPQLSGQGQSFGVSFGYGGGANQGGNTGSISGGMGLGGFGPGQGGSSVSGFGGTPTGPAPRRDQGASGASGGAFNNGILGMSSKPSGGGGDDGGGMMERAKAPGFNPYANRPGYGRATAGGKGLKGITAYSSAA